MSIKSPEKPPKTLEEFPSAAGQTIGNYLLNQLFQRGAKHIFGLPGDYVLRLDKLIEQHAIQFINTTRENTAGYLADAYARICGIGVACITYGVGINIANALSQAYAESSPLVLISGTSGTKEHDEGHKLHHMLNRSIHNSLDTTQLDIFKHLTVDQAVIKNPTTAASDIQRVLSSCLREKKPVYIEIPRDLVDQLIIVPTPSASKHRSDPESLREALEETTLILANCERPVIWVGHEIQRFGLASDVVKFAEKYRIPFVSSILGKTVIDENHPLFAGVYLGKISLPEVREFVEGCDCLFILGVNLNDVETGIFTASLHQDTHILVSSEELSINHHHYHEVLLIDYIKGLADLPLNFRFEFPYPACSKRLSHPFVATSQKITTARLFSCIQKYSNPEQIIVSDMGDCLFGSLDLILSENSFICNAYFGSIGFGTPGAIGAQIAAPQKRVIGIVGDGAFQITGMELSTAVRYHLDPIIIVMNNHGYATERPLLEGKYNDILDWNYAELPKVFGGGKGIKVQTEEELETAFVEALSNRGVFYLIQVELDRLDFSPALRRFGKILNLKNN